MVPGRGSEVEGAEKLENELFEGEYADAYSDYSWAIWTLQDLLEQDNPKRTAKDLYRSTAGEIEARDAANRRHLDAGARKNRLPDTGDERTVFAEGDSPVARSENIVDQMRSALPEVMEMDSVATIDISNATEYVGVHKLDEKAGLAEFRRQGGSAYREGFGKVLLSRKGAVDTVFHGNGPAKQASFPAIKAVIERGVEVGSDPDHKGRGYDTVTFAAPIDFFGDKKLLGVVVKVYRNGRGDTAFYIHEICDSEGNYVRMDEIKEISNTGGLDSSSSAGIADSEVSLKNSLLDSGQNVKQYSMKDSEGRELSEEQQEFFRDSKVRDEQGRLMVMYHGTPNGGFSVFNETMVGSNTDYGYLGRGFYFTSKERVAKHYAGYLGTSEVKTGYLNITNPYIFEKKTDVTDEVETILDTHFLGEDAGRERSEAFTVWLRKNGYDGVICQSEAMALRSNQFKNADSTAPTDDPDIRYSLKEDENGFTEGWHDDDEAARAAQMEGYPVLNGVQVVPMKTWVRARDYKRNPDGSIFYDRQGNPVQYDNYGLVAGLGDKPGTLKINFHNKNVVNEETGQTIRRDNVQIAYEDLTPAPGVFSQTDEDFDSLIGQAPEEPGSYDYSEEELAEIEELRNRASMEEDATEERPVWTAVEPEKLGGQERDFYDRARRKLAEQVAQALDVPQKAKREFLEPIAQRIAEEYLRAGTVSQELRDQLFEEGWKQGIVVDREFYDTYKEVKDYLRTTGITLSETDRDSRDWAEFRKRSFGTLKLVNKGGLPVDTAWGELQGMAPALFPSDILNPEDMVKHMYEVGRSIRKVERSLDEFYGPDAALMKQASRNDFEVAVQMAMAELRQVKRVADEQIGRAHV